MNKPEQEFLLHSAVDRWCQQIVDKSRTDRTTIDELQDHLYCEIERQLANGVPIKEAFALATQQLGDPTLLNAEFAKNRSLLSKLICEGEEHQLATEKTTMSKKKLQQLTIANLILFAVIIAATAWILDGTGTFTQISLLMYALWFSMYMSFYAANRQSDKSEWACLKQKVLNLARRG
ncbi:MAG: hypothetical protein U0175_38710 [Caldilineaceae bacterium]